MNFLETLMLYMSLTFAGSVQDATLTTPTPSPTPTMIVDTMLADQTATPTLVPTATPTATPTPSPEPTPTMTPNTAYDLLRYGDRSDDVKKMQERLIELGYLGGTADGVYGFNTRRAVILFQKEHGLTPDGDAGRVTLTFLYEYEGARRNPDAPDLTPTPPPTEPPAETPTAPSGEPGTTVIPTTVPTEAPPTITPNKAYKLLNYGDTGNDVKKLQQRLIELGYLNDKADGKYGNNTRNAVRAFQQAHGLAADGEAGRITQTYLYEYEHVQYNPNAPTPTPSAAPTEVPTEAPPEALMVRQNDVTVTLDSLGAITYLEEIDGVQHRVTPRVYKYVDGRIYVSLFDLCSAVEEWSLVTDEASGTYTVTANGHTAVFTIVSGAFTCQVDGGMIETLDPTDASTLFGDTMVSIAVLESTLALDMTWDDAECALMIQTASTEGLAG